MYKEDHLDNSISGNDVQQTCKWYDIIDEYMHNCAHVTLYRHASSSPTPMSQNASNSATMEVPKTTSTPTTKTNILSCSGLKDAQMDDFISKVTENGHGIIAFLEKESAKRDAIEATREVVES